MKNTTLKTALLGMTAAFLFLSCQKDLTNSPKYNTTDLRPLTAQEAKTVSSSNDFAFRLLQKLQPQQPNQNLFVSPLSISSALTMALNGADGTTKEAMQQTLGFALQTDKEINQSFKSLQDLLTGLDNQVNFTTANSIWYAQQYELQAPFVQQNQTYFNATVQKLNFSSPTAKNTINDWVKEKTQGKIPDIVQEIRPDHVLFLVNALYFKGTWTYPFDKKLTQKAPFRQEDGSTAQVDFMTLKNGEYLYFNDASKQVIDLPYGNRQFSMTIIVPNGQETVSNLTRQLNADQLATWLGKANTTKLDLRLPKFKLEYKKELKETLKQLGMGEAFSNQANFSRMVAGSTGGLAISEVMHKTFVEVNEEGTEAAAATSVGVVLTSLPPTIQVDRPFIFLIREKSSNAILFIGQLMNP
ncbi:serpin [Adhaeribacter aerolatus]|uniref:Serpin n=1 Tax=Adhaeribacter aerolatus TaxID=670289 RepID=A0A512B285_9BACT|nr:serpin family protein [Adhaeribacter aerolatus]GEO06085.1 serpin [Adhaeribacter aerolatus]